MKTEIYIVYRLFGYEDNFRRKNFELQNCRSIESYNFYIKFTSIRVQIKKYKFLKRDWTPTARPHGVRCIALHFFGSYIFEKKKKEKCKKKEKNRKSGLIPNPAQIIWHS
jgi:hypothetical protein